MITAKEQQHNHHNKSNKPMNINNKKNPDGRHQPQHKKKNRLEHSKTNHLKTCDNKNMKAVNIGDDNKQTSKHA